MINFKPVLVAAVGAASMAVAAAAGADTPDASVPKLVVYYSPASLSTDQGVHQLYGRLVSAAEKVCENLQLGRLPNRAQIACQKQAMADAVAQIHNARLAELSAAYSKKA